LNFVLEFYSSLGSSEAWPSDGSPCISCNDAFNNDLPLSSYNCNPKGRPKFSVSFKFYNAGYLITGMCTNFNENSIPSKYVLYYMYNGVYYADYYIGITSSYSPITTYSPSSLSR